MAEAGGKDPAALAEALDRHTRLWKGCYKVRQFDVIVVGAGPTGLACGIELKQRGLNTVLIEKGCVVNSLYNYPTHMVFFTTPELLEIGDMPMTSLNEKPGRTEALKYYRRVAEYYGLSIHQYERVLSIAGDDGDFHVRTSKADYRARKIVLATGYYDIPNMLDVPGEDLDKVIHYYKEPHPYYDHDVLVVGAKNSAAIAALELYWTGARVTMVHRGAKISDRVKYWIKPNIENRIKSGEIAGFFNSRLIEIHEQSVAIETPEGPETLKNDFVFAMIGYRPDLEFLESIGIRLDPALAEAAHQSRNARKRPAGDFPRGRDRGRNAHQRNLHREWPLPRKTDRRGYRRFAGSLAIDIIDLMISRRDFAKIAAAAAVPVLSARPFAMIDSKFSGVMIGAQTYSFRDLPSLDACIAAMKEIGLGYAELWDNQILPKDRSQIQAWRSNPPMEEIRGDPQKVR